jgi:hypothetical protein
MWEEVESSQTVACLPAEQLEKTDICQVESACALSDDKRTTRFVFTHCPFSAVGRGKGTSSISF